MADLMTASTNMTSLMNKYDNFMVPAKKLFIDNKEVLKSGVDTDSISVTLSLDASSSVTFSIYEGYDLNSRKFQSGITDMVSLGSKVSLELGYGSQTVKVFEGFIGELTYQFGEYPCLQATAFDVRRLMMEGRNRVVSYTEKSYSGVFCQLMKSYNKLCGKTKVDKTPELKDQPITQNASDYEFVINTLCKNGDREFFVYAGQAYFRKIKGSKSPIVSLEWGRDLLSFTRRSQYQYNTIKVVGYDDEKKVAVEAQTVAKAGDKQKNLGNAQTTTLQPDAKNKEEAQKIAEYLMQKQQDKARQGNASCIGLPEIVPGRYIDIKKCDSAVDGKYYIKQVSHTFDSSGFSTSFEVGGW